MILAPVAASPLAYLAGRLELRMRPSHRIGLARYVALAGLLAAWVPFAAAARVLASHHPVVFGMGAVLLRLDGLGLLVAAIVLFVGPVVIWVSGPAMAGAAGEEKCYAILAGISGVIIGLGVASDLFNLWLWFEAMAVMSYVLVVFYADRRPSLEAGVKYLIQSATGSALVLIGIALVLLATGTLDLGRLHHAAVPSPLLTAAVALFIIGFGIKAALVPLHTWLPDAYSEAPAGVSAVLSSIVTQAGLIALFRVLAALANVTPLLGAVLLAAGAVNMLTGNLMALRQTQVKRLLAYSSISQIGYIVFGVGITFSVGQPLGAEGGVFQLLTNGLMKALGFLAAGALLYAMDAPTRGEAPLSIADLAGAARRYPLPALALSVAVLGLGGLPPLAGFVSKWSIFVASFAAHRPAIAALGVFAALNSVLSLAYYAPIVNAVYRERPSTAVLGGRRVPATMGVGLALLSLVVLAIGIWPIMVRWLISPAGAAVAAALGRTP